MKTGEEMDNLEEVKKEKEEFLQLDNQEEELIIQIPCHESGENFIVKPISLECDKELENGEICGGVFFAYFSEYNVSVCVHGTLIIKIQCNSCKQKTETFISFGALREYATSIYNYEVTKKSTNDNRPYPGQYL